MSRMDGTDELRVELGLAFRERRGRPWLRGQIKALLLLVRQIEDEYMGAGPSSRFSAPIRLAGTGCAADSAPDAGFGSGARHAGHRTMGF